MPIIFCAASIYIGHNSGPFTWYLQELREKKKQLQATISEAADTQALQRMQDTTKRLDEELGDMAVHLALLQHRLEQLPASKSVLAAPLLAA